jgi:glycerol 3-phosphatase-2
VSLSPLLAAYDHVILDLDGCVWIGEKPTRRAAEAIAELRAAQKTIAFVTNDAQHSPEDYVRKLWSLGIQASLEEVVTVGAAIQYVLADRGTGASVYVIGAPAIFRHVTDSGQRVVNGTSHESEAEIVVVAGHADLEFADLDPAIRSVLAGAHMIGAGRDRTYPTEAGISAGTGALIAALEYATERSATIAGKPDPQIFRTALDRLGPGRTLVIGDRLDADLYGAAAAGLDGAIVLTGVTSAEAAAVAEDPAPVAIAPDLYALVTEG